MLRKKLSAGAIHVPLSREHIPRWVSHEPYGRIDKIEDEFVSGGILRLLQDFQTDLTTSEPAFYTRTVNYVATANGVDAAAQVAADFDPEFQRVEIHAIRVIRGELVIDRANIEAFRIQRRERDPGRRAIDGRLTASMTIPDVRAGDVVEVCLTVYGSSPALNGHFSSWVAIDGVEPVLETRHRVRCGPERTLSILPINGASPPRMVRKDGLTEHVWQATRRGSFAYEPLSPPWVIQGEVTQIADGTSWPQIAAMFAFLSESEAMPADLQEAADAIAREHPTRAARAAEALRFVQTRLHHIALPFSEARLALRPLAEVWASGCGDCKDAVRLFLAMAHYLKLDACPALVSTSHGPILNTLLPAVNVFDHCIARLSVEGKSYWLDPSLNPQAGELDVVVQPFSGYALALAPDTTDLEAMTPSVPATVVESEEHFKFGPYVGTAATLERKTVYGAWRADRLRDLVAQKGAAVISAATLAALQPGFPDAKEQAAVRLEDHPQENSLSVFEAYRIPHCWRKKDTRTVSFGTQDTLISRELALLPDGPRKTDIHLGRPRVVRRFVYLHMPKDWTCTPWDRTLEMPGLVYRSRLYRKNKRFLVFAQLVAIGAETAPKSEAKRYNEIVRAIGEQCDIALLAANKNGEIRRPRGNPSLWRKLAYGLLAVAALAAIGAAAFLAIHR